MKILRIHLALLSLFSFLLISTASAEDRKAHQNITLNEDVIVNNTLLEKGTYRVTFYADTGEVKFTEDDGDVVLRTKATIATMDDEADRDEMHMAATPKGQMITKLVFDGHSKYAVFTDTNVSASDD